MSETYWPTQSASMRLSFSTDMFWPMFSRWMHLM